jgi:hypothetical protein
MFTSYPAYPKYRALKLKSPNLYGEDVYALQTGLVYLGYSVGSAGTDGYFGPATDKAVRKFQSDHHGAPFNLVVDGIAGGQSQRAVAYIVTQGLAVDTGVPFKRLYGQEEHESSFWLGIYSQQYSNDSYDAGVVQRNTQFTPPKDGFDVKPSIAALAKRVKDHYVLFEGLPTDRRWDLAQGSWNAPAFACYIAKEEGATKVPTSSTKEPTDEQRQTFETYVAAVSTYA